MKKRPKIEQFAECFPGKISFGDVDARVEINGKFLELEWKSYRGPIPFGQKRTFDQLIQRGDYTIFIVAGDAETMRIDGVQILHPGVDPKWRNFDLPTLKECIRRWAKKAKTETGSTTARGYSAR